MRYVIARLALTTFAFASFILLTSCGGGNSGEGGPVQPVNPQFTSTPPTSATEGVTYSYDPIITGDGGAGTLGLTEAPAGATLSEAGVTRVPTLEQSRKPNNFTLKVMAHSGGSASQSWTVTPSGTVRVSLIDTIWDESGSRTAPYDPVVSTQMMALVPKADGTTETIYATGGANGAFSIANVPGGYYWLQEMTGQNWYWTNSSNVDLGADYNAPQTFTVISNPQQTILHFDITGIEPVMGGFLNIRLGPWFSIGSPIFGGGPNQSLDVPVTMPVDWTNITTGRAIEFKPAMLGAIKGQVVGPTASLLNLTITNGGTDVIPVPLVSSPQNTLNVNLRGSAWAPLFTKVAPGMATLFSTPFSLSVDPNMPTASARMALAGRSIQLLAPMEVSTDPTWNGLIFGAAADRRSNCSGIYSPTLPPFSAPVVMTDQAISTEYGDPFPAEWKRYLAICQQATVDVPTPDGTATQKFVLSNGAMMSATVADIAPVVGPVENPTINDRDLFTKATVSAQSYTLKWTKPTLGTPTGYVIRVLSPFVRNEFSGYAPVGILNTATTSLTIPPDVLHTGQTYLFLITAVVDGRANVETAPRRTGVPIANADIISAPITIAAQ